MKHLKKIGEESHTIISDAIFERITGEGGYFDTRVVYVAESGPKESKGKKISYYGPRSSKSPFFNRWFLSSFNSKIFS